MRLIIHHGLQYGPIQCIFSYIQISSHRLVHPYFPSRGSTLATLTNQVVRAIILRGTARPSAMSSPATRRRRCRPPSSTTNALNQPITKCRNAALKARVTARSPVRAVRTRHSITTGKRDVQNIVLVVAVIPRDAGSIARRR
jgi:hypothetical protein